MKLARMTYFSLIMDTLKKALVFLTFDRQAGKSKGYSLILYKTIEAKNRTLEDLVKSIDPINFFVN